MIFPEFVEVYGQEDWERSLPALEFFTRFGSAEFAVRPFLQQDPERWLGHSPRTDWIVKHACRGLLKARHERALQLFGFGDSEQVAVANLKLEKQRLLLGADLTFAFELHVSGDGAHKLRLEYAIDFVKANGKTSQKVFQLSEKSYDAGVYPLRKKHATADLTTRKHYPGTHQLAVVVNGKELAVTTFDIIQEVAARRVTPARHCC